MEYIIAIPSYHRENTLRDKTLKMLSDYGIDKNLIYIFVATQEEKLKYQSVLNGYYKEIIVGCKGLVSIRNFITNYFQDGERVVCFDDDVNKLIDLNGDKLSDLKDFIEKAWDLSYKYNCHLWGVYPSSNAYFMKNKVSFDLRLIVGPFFGHIIDKDTILNISNAGQSKEDHERTILYYQKYGRVMRFNNVGIDTNYYGGAGGIEDDRVEGSFIGAKYLFKNYPQFCDVNHNRKSKYIQIKLVDKIKRDFKR